MDAYDVSIIILAALILATRIAGAKFFAIVDDDGARVEGIRCRIASWSFQLVLGLFILLSKEYDLPIRVAGGTLSTLAAGGVVWEVVDLLTFFTQKQGN